MTSYRQPQDRKGFFDLPRELRDVIYEYAVANIGSYPGHSCGTQVKCTVQLSAFRFCYGARYSDLRFACPVPEMWLAAISRVSRQFASELRPVFWHRWLFEIRERPRTILDDEADRESTGYVRWLRRSGESISPSQAYEKLALGELVRFIRDLGKEAQDLRRLKWSLNIEFEGSPIASTITSAVTGAIASMKDRVHADVSILVEINATDLRTDQHEETAYALGLEGRDVNRRVIIEKLSDARRRAWRGWTAEDRARRRALDKWWARHLAEYGYGERGGTDDSSTDED